MKLVAKPEKTIKQNPRDWGRDEWNRLRDLVEKEACHEAWGCCLYKMHRLGRIDNDEREAGDRYIQVVNNYIRLEDTDPEEGPDTELAYRRVNRAKRRYREVTEEIGFGRRVLDPLLFDERWPVGEKEHLIVKQSLMVLKNFFATGTKRKRKVA